MEGSGAGTTAENTFDFTHKRIVFQFAQANCGGSLLDKKKALGMHQFNPHDRI
jgi:hypothetical protein